MSHPFDVGRSVHIVGIGGAGMSALARVLHQRGCVVSGCDARDSATLQELRREGINAVVGHNAHHVNGVGVVTASPALSSDSLELAQALRDGVPVLTRAQVMGELGRLTSLIGFAGTHGKTTSASMATHIWSAAQRQPSWLIGADVRGLGSNGHYHESSPFIAEVDESFGTFGLLAPYALGITNVDPDHLDFYGDEETLRRAFVALIDRTSGPVAIWTDQLGAREVARAASRRVTRIGRSTNNDVVVSDVQLTRSGSTFILRTGDSICHIELRVPGELNVINSAVAASVALGCGVDATSIEIGLRNFSGVARRFELRALLDGTAIVDDYAHLPAEVSATIAAARAVGYKKIVAVFQPHRVTRTLALASSFLGAFDGVDELIVTNIYTSGEPNPDAVTGEIVASAVAGSGTVGVHYVAELADAAAQLARRLGQCDLILVLGAGDVHRIVEYLTASAAP